MYILLFLLPLVGTIHCLPLPTPRIGKVDMEAVERLRASGLSEKEITAHLPLLDPLTSFFPFFAPCPHTPVALSPHEVPSLSSSSSSFFFPEDEDGNIPPGSLPAPTTFPGKLEMKRAAEVEKRGTATVAQLKTFVKNVLATAGRKIGKREEGGYEGFEDLVVRPRGGVFWGQGRM